MKKIRIVFIILSAVFVSLAFIFPSDTSDPLAQKNPHSVAAQPQSEQPNVFPDREAVLVYDGVTLRIPAGAVDQPVCIRVEKLKKIQELSSGIANVTGQANGYRFLPNGMKFQKDILITMPYEPSSVKDSASLEDLYTFFYNESKGYWEQLERVSVNEKDGTVTSKTPHFTDMINGVLTLPQSPNPLNFNPTSIKDIKAADPGAGIDLIEAPQANAQGNAALRYPIEVPAGRNGMQPQIAVQYNSDGGNGWMGLGWDTSYPSITVETRWGTPRYDANKETETYLLNGMQLTPLAHRGSPVARTGEKVFHSRVEGDFQKIVRHGSNPSSYWWEVTDKKGKRYFYGGLPESGLQNDCVLKTDAGQLFKWALVQERDTHDNTVDYRYAVVQDSGTGDGSGNVKGIQLYLDTIYYTGTVNTPGVYSLRYVRASEMSGEPRRNDITIDARNGKKVVTADLLRAVEVMYQNSLVRRYEMRYRTGAFSKTLLQNIIVYGKDGSEFNRHTLDYYDDIDDGSGNYNGFGGQSDWNTVNDDLSFSLFNIVKATALGGTGRTSGGGHLYLGIGIGSKANSAGFKVGGNGGGSEDLITTIDLNGDGLPDKVFKKDGVILFRANQGPADNPSFGPAVQVAGILSFSMEKSDTISFGGEAYALGLANVMGNIAFSHTYGNVYFSDVNGDGLPDLVQDGIVLFNHLVNGVPTFDLDAGHTPVPIGSGNVDMAGMIQVSQDQYNQTMKNAPLMDAIRVWKAPYSGQVEISGAVSLVEIDHTNYAMTGIPDGVRVAIQKNGSEIWSKVIGPSDYTEHLPEGTGSVAVSKGDLLYFRVNSIYDGAFDKVKWDPAIRYLNVTNATDANGLEYYQYRASQDFIYTGHKSAVQASIGGTVRLHGNLSKTDVTSDGIRMKMYLNGSLYLSRSMDWNDTGEIILDETFHVNSNDLIQLKLETDSPIDMRKIEWAPEIYYESADDTNMRVKDKNGNPLNTQAAFYESDLYSWQGSDKAQGYWEAPTNGLLVILPKIASYSNGSAVFTIKKANEMVFKTNMVILHPTNTKQARLEMNVVEGDRFYFDFSSKDPLLVGQVSQSVIVYITNTNINTNTNTNHVVDPYSIPTNAPNDFHCVENPRWNSFPRNFRGWAYVAYDGNSGYDGVADRAFAAIIESDLNISTNANTNSLPKAFVLYPQPSESKRFWDSGVEGCYVQSNIQCSTRRGTTYVVRPGEDTPSGGGRGVVRRSYANQTTLAGGFGPLSYSASTGISGSLLDFIDLNGDRYPDIVGMQKVQYTTPDGGMEANNRTVYGMAPEIRMSSNYSRIGGVGGNIPQISCDSKGNVSESKEMMPSIGISFIFDDDEYNKSQRDLIDINGDGLPDQVWVVASKIFVSLNLGYAFAPAEIWGDAEELSHGITKNNPLGVTLGYNDGTYGWAIGASYSENRGKEKKGLFDINGDGLPDIVMKDAGNTMTVAINNGHGFNSPVQWKGGFNERPISETANVNYGIGGYFTIAITLIPTPFAIIINPGADVGTTGTRREATLMDVNGDGLPDHVVSDNDGQLIVSLNRTGIANRLKKVSRPLGASFELTYHREGNTYNMPHNAWVLDSVTVHDGVNGDGADTQKTVFEYRGGQYNRLEREFYGFNKVITKQLDTENSDAVYRKVVRTYHTDSFYLKGLLDTEEVRDATTPDGAIFTKTVNAYRKFNVDSQTELADVYPVNTVATVFPELIKTEKYFYEGQATSGIYTYQTFEYDAYGNVTRFVDVGNTGTSADDAESDVDYEYNTDRYIVANPTNVNVYGGASRSLLRHREGSYDTTTGDLLQLRQYLDIEHVQMNDFEYYPSGNLKKVTLSPNNDGQRYVTEMEYDPVLGAHITKVSDSFGYFSTADYDYLFGLEKKSTDLNGNSVQKVYDNFGRLTKVFGPYDRDIPAVEMEYHPDEPSGAPARALTKNKVHFDPNNSETLDTVLFTDGLKRVIQTKKEGEVLYPGETATRYGMNVTGKVTFDAFGRTVRQGQPVFEEGYATNYNGSVTLKNPTTTAYDVLDRTVKTTLPDTSVISTAFSIENELFKTVVTDPLTNVKNSYQDVKGDTVKVEQYKDGGTQSQKITTTYDYDPLDQIVKIADHNSNLTVMTYDALGRRLSINNPDSGLTEYEYDLPGNLVVKRDANLRAKNKVIRYQYYYNRLEKTIYPESPEVSYEYGEMGAGYNRAGRLYKTTDESGTSESQFGKLGEETKTVKTMNFLVPGHEPWTFETSQVFDYLGRVQEMTYPDGEVLTYVYDRGGQIKAAYGEKNGTDHYDYVKQISYDEFGQRVYVKFGNDTSTRYTYDPLRRWLANINTKNGVNTVFQNANYTFDRVGNILAISNAAQNTWQKFQYDSLYELVKAEGSAPDKNKTSSYTQTFSYDNIGNMTRKVSVNLLTPGNVAPKELNYDFAYVYGGTKPHAPSQIGNWAYTYDANGNTIKKDRTGLNVTTDIPGSGNSGEFIWNEENRLKEAKVNGKSTTFLYNVSGERTIKRGQGGETLYVNNNFQLQNRQEATKHIFVGTSRIVSKLSHYSQSGGLYDSGYERRNIYTYHPDHLGSSSLISDPNGNIFERMEYTPFGETWVDEGANKNIIGYRFTSKELDNETGLYYFGARYLDPQAGRWLSTDPAFKEYFPNIAQIRKEKENKQNEDEIIHPLLKIIYESYPTKYNEIIYKLPNGGGVYKPLNINIYQYCGNNPIIYLDPDGLLSEKGDIFTTAQQFNQMKNAIKSALKGEVPNLSDESAEIVAKSITSEMNLFEAGTLQGLDVENNKKGQDPAVIKENTKKMKNIVTEVGKRVQKYENAEVKKAREEYEQKKQDNVKMKKEINKDDNPKK